MCAFSNEKEKNNLLLRGQLHFQGYPTDIGHGAIYMATDGDAQGMRVGHVKDLQNCEGPVRDLLRTAMDRFADEKNSTKDWSYDCFFNP